jgi:hypothetical protein
MLTSNQEIKLFLFNTSTTNQLKNNNKITTDQDFDNIDLLNELIKTNYFTKGNNSLIFVVLYSISIIIGLIVNSIVIITVIKYRHMRTVTNAFVINLTIFDLLVILFCMPSRILNEINSQWFLNDNNEILCKLSSFIQDSAVSGSILTLTFISCTRIYAVHYPFKVKLFLTKFKLITFIILIWLVVLLFSSPSLIFKQMHTTEIYLNLNIDGNNKTLKTKNFITVKACIEDWKIHNRIYKKIYTLVFFIFFYFLPLIVIFGNYMKIAQQMFNFKLFNYQRKTKNINNNKSTFDFTSSLADSFSQQNNNNNNDFRYGSVLLLQKSRIFKFKKAQQIEEMNTLPTTTKITTTPLERNLNKSKCKSSSTHSDVTTNSSNSGCQTKKFWERRFQQRRKICKMFVLISALFGISWAPTNVINLLIELNLYNENMNNFNLWYYYALWFGHLNSIINPLCYALCCKKFKQCFFKK